MTTLSKRLYKGKKRLAKKLLAPRRQKLLLWALSIKPGDYIATCEGCNRKVEKIEESWANEGGWRRGKPNKTWVLNEVVFIDTNGRMHHCPGGGCAYPAETPEEVVDYHKEWAFYEKREERIRFWYGKDVDRAEKSIAHWLTMKEALESGKPIVDEHGELLPEFDRSPYG